MNSVVDVTHSFENIYEHTHSVVDRVCMYLRVCVQYPTRRFIWLENPDFHEISIVVPSF